MDTVNTRYNAFGDVTERGINGKYSEKMDYDNAGRLWRTTSGDGAYKYFMYDNNGNQTLVFTSDGRNIDNKSIAQILAIWGVSSNGANANRINTDYEADITAVITKYDARNLAVEVREPERQYNNAAGTIVRSDLVTKRVYNAFGEVTAETDANNQTINYTYNTMGRRTKVQSPTVSVTSATGVKTNVRPTENYYYDISGRLVASRDANGNLTKQTLLAGTGYNGTQALITKTTAADGGTVTTAYDIQGNARKITDQIGRVTTNSFDRMGRLTQSNLASGLVNYYGYDSLGQQISQYNNQLGSGVKQLTDYDAQGRVIRQVAFGGDTTSTSYSWSGTGVLAPAGGWLQTTTFANGKQSKVYKDVFNKVIRSYDLSNRQTNYTYDKGGRLTDMSGAGADTQKYYYLNTGKLDKLVVSGSHYNYAYYDASSFSRTATYGYDKVGNLTSEKLTESTAVEYVIDFYDDYEYDDYDDYYNDYESETYTQTTNLTLQNSRATYDALGRLKTWNELGTAAQSGYTTSIPAASKVFEYDAQGNIRKTVSTHKNLDYKGDATGSNIVTESWYKFDTMNRIVTADGDMTAGQIVRGSSGVDIAYDKAGQRRYVLKDITTTTYNPGSEDYIEEYYEAVDYDDYDGTYQDFLDDSGYTDSPGSYSTSTTLQREDYTYNAGGQVTRVDIDGMRRSAQTYDLMGRQTRQIDYQANGTTAAFDSTKVYNSKSQITTDTSITRRYDGLFKTRTTYAYGYGASYALGGATTVTTQNYKKNSTYQVEVTSRTTNTYAYYNSAALARTTYDSNTSSSSDQISTTLYSNSKSGVLLSARVSDGRARTVTFTNDNQGQTIAREEKDNKTGGDPHEIWYRFGGKEMGYVGNNGTSNTTYKASITDRTTKPSTGGAFRHGRSSGSSYADFDQAYEAINSYKQGSSAGAYTVRGGDTLQSIAANVYGDSSLWYKIAQTNGLTGGAALIEGQSLNLPSGVVKSSHNADTFKPYSPGDITGDLNPTEAHPQKASGKGKKCGVIGAILLVVVAVAVTIATQGAASTFFAGAFGASAGATTGVAVVAGNIVGGAVAAAAGSVASQVVGVATGIQEKFSFKNVALAAIGGGVGAGLGGIGQFDKLGTFGAGAARGAIGSAVSQGIGVATGLQDSFSWVSVAAAGIGGGVGAVVGDKLGIQPLAHSGGRSASNIAGHLATSSAQAIASAATRSAIEGSSFGDNIIASIPDVIGGTLGRVIGACFTAETPVHTPNGLKRIDEIKVGDWVYSRDEHFKDDRVMPKRVIELYRFEDRATLDVTVSFENGDETTLRTTPEHPFAVAKTDDEYMDDLEAGRVLNADTLTIAKSFTWTSAGDLAIGDKTVDMDGRVGLVSALDSVGGLSTVHNFAVEDFHTYYVGDGPSVWVHNTYTPELEAQETRVKSLISEVQLLEKQGATGERLSQLKYELGEAMRGYTSASENAGDLRSLGIVPEGETFQTALTIAEAYRLGWDDLQAGLRKDGFPEDANIYDYIVGLGVSESNASSFLENITFTSAMKHLDGASLPEGWKDTFLRDVGYRTASSRLSSFKDISVLKSRNRRAFAGVEGTLTNAALAGISESDLRLLQYGTKVRNGVSNSAIFLEVGTLGVGGVLGSVRQSAAPAVFRSTEAVAVSGKSTRGLADSYEAAVRKLFYKESSLSSRQFAVRNADGTVSTRTADGVISQGNRRYAADAKFVKDWSKSLRNPNSAGGMKPWAVAERKSMLAQAKTYSKNFDGAVYHTNSPKLATYYNDLFRGNGINNVEFVITPIK